MDRLSKVTSRLSNPWPFRQMSMPYQGDGPQPSGKQSLAFRTLSRSTTNLLTTGGAELKSVNEAEHANASLATQPHTINVVLFGETGVGKSSVINLIARKEVAKVSSDVNGCTMQSTQYDIPFDDMNFSIFDTIGLEEPQMGINGYLKAIEKAYELIAKLSAAGGIHLLLFCMRGGRITATTQSNYRLFCECLCGTKVPIALVFTGLERELEMENWWTRNKTHIEHYGIRSDGHACVTAVQDDTPGEDLKFMESQKKIRELLKTCALKDDAAFSPESNSWFARLGRGMRNFIEKHRSPKKRDIMKVLTQRCKLDHETARKIVDMMEKGETETKKEEPQVPGEGECGPSPVKIDWKRESDGTDHTSDHPPPNIQAESGSSGMEQRAESKPAKTHTGKARSLTSGTDGNDESKPTKTDTGKVRSLTSGTEGNDESVVTVQPESTTKGNAQPASQHGDVCARPSVAGAETHADGKDESGLPVRSHLQHNSAMNQPDDTGAVPPTGETERKDESKPRRKSVVKARPPVDAIADGMEGTVGRRSRRSENGGDQCVHSGVPEQAKPKRGDNKWRAVGSSVSSGSRQPSVGHGSQL